MPAGVGIRRGERLDVLGDQLAVPRVVELAADEALGGADGEIGHLAAQRLDRLLLLVLDLALALLDEVLGPAQRSFPTRRTSTTTSRARRTRRRTAAP